MALNGYAFLGGALLLIALFFLYRRWPKFTGALVAVMTVTLLLWNVIVWVWEV